MDNQYKYPALPTVVPNSRKIVLDVPTVCNFTKDNDSYTYTINYPMKSKATFWSMPQKSEKNRRQ
jgi:hypothetical protein